MLKVYHCVKDMNINQLHHVYSGNQDIDVVDYLYEFFRMPGSVCLIWDTDGAYQSALRLEPYSDGYLLTGLETAPDTRRMGYGYELMQAALVYLKNVGSTKVYAHIKKNNVPSLKLHEKCGFSMFSDCATLLDGTVSQLYVTVYAEI